MRGNEKLLLHRDKNPHLSDLPSSGFYQGYLFAKQKLLSRDEKPRLKRVTAVATTKIVSKYRSLHFFPGKENNRNETTYHKNEYVAQFLLFFKKEKASKYFHIFHNPYRIQTTILPVDASGTFDSLCRVLFTIRSFYLCAISLVPVFRLARDPPRNFKLHFQAALLHGIKGNHFFS